MITTHEYFEQHGRERSRVFFIPLRGFSHAVIDSTLRENNIPYHGIDDISSFYQEWMGLYDPATHEKPIDSVIVSFERVTMASSNADHLHQSQIKMALDLGVRLSHTVVAITEYDQLTDLSDLLAGVTYLQPALVANLPSIVRTDISLRISFDFPEPISAACEQYLMFFRHFLSEIGIKATTDITHEAGQALFSVTPIDPTVALVNIREALNVYLKLPEVSLSVDSASVEDRIAAKEIAAQVNHLNGQLELAEAKLEAKQATVTALETTLAAQRLAVQAYLISQGKNVLIDAARDVILLPEPAPIDVAEADEPTEKVHLFGKLITVKPIKIRDTIEINLPELINKMRKKNAENDGRGNSDWPLPMP